MQPVRWEIEKIEDYDGRLRILDQKDTGGQIDRESDVRNISAQISEEMAIIVSKIKIIQRRLSQELDG